MASSRDRQRKLARAKLDRQLARQAARERRRRRVLAGVGSGVAVLLIVAGIAWIGGAFDSDDKTDPAAQEICAWTPQSATTNTNLRDVGTPPTKDIPTSGTETMTVATDQGEPIVVTLDLTSAPCGAEDLRYLASKNFYDKTTCHEITTYGAIRCGDPSGTGLGGPTYSIEKLVQGQIQKASKKGLTVTVRPLPTASVHLQEKYYADHIRALFSSVD